MSEIPVCPYCGASPWSGSPPATDGTIKIRCDRCAGTFEYIPGYGTFSLPEMGRDAGHERMHSGPTFEDDRSPFPAPRPRQESNCGTCCLVCCCMWLLLPFLFMLFLFPFTLF